MQSITIQIKRRAAIDVLQNPEKEKAIRIVAQHDFEYPSLPGAPLSLKEDFKKWISDAENSDLMELKAARNKWKIRKEKLEPDNIAIINILKSRAVGDLKISHSNNPYFSNRLKVRYSIQSMFHNAYFSKYRVFRGAFKFL